METFFGYMNCVSPMTYPTYRDMNKDMTSCYINVAAQSMLQAARELRNDNNVGVNDIFDTSVSCDGTWQKGVIPLSMVLSP